MRPKAAQPNLVKSAMAPLEAIEPVRQSAMVRIRGCVGTFDFREERAALKKLDVVALREEAQQMREQFVGPTNTAAARALFGLMLDAIPSARQLDALTYLDALMNTLLGEPDRDEHGRDVAGFTPVIIAAAVRKIWRESTFAPSIAEVLTTLRKTRKELHATVMLCERAIEKHEALNAPAPRENSRSDND